MSSPIDLTNTAQMNSEMVRTRIDLLIDMKSKSRFTQISQNNLPLLNSVNSALEKVSDTFSQLEVFDLDRLLDRVHELKLDQELKNKINIICGFRDQLALQHGRKCLLKALQKSSVEFKDCNTLDQALKNKEALLEITEIDLWSREDTLCVLPPEIGLLTNLKTLNLNNSQLQELPEEIGLLTNLECLFAHGNKLQTLPKTIGQLINLKTLNLNHSRLQKFPPEIKCLTSLERLYLDGNMLCELPEEIGLLKNLKSLSLSYNKFQELPKQIQLLSNL